MVVTCVQLLEAVQLLYSAWADCERPAEFVVDPYKITHSKHPVAMWVRSSSHAYKWGLQYAEGLLEQYRSVYNKEHKCGQHVDQLIAAGVPPTVPKEFSGEWEGKLDTTVLATEVVCFGVHIICAECVCRTYRQTRACSRCVWVTIYMTV